MVHPEEQDQSHTSSSEEEPLRRQVSDIPIENPLERRLKSQKDEQTIKELKEKFHQGPCTYMFQSACMLLISFHFLFLPFKFYVDKHKLN